MVSYLEFEKPVADLEGQIHELRSVDKEENPVDISEEIEKLEKKSSELLKNLYSKLTP